MEFFNSAVDVLKTLVVALGAGLGVWGAVNLMEGYGGDNPSAKSQGMKQLMAGGGVALIGITLVPLLSGLFGRSFPGGVCRPYILLASSFQPHRGKRILYYKGSSLQNEYSLLLEMEAIFMQFLTHIIFLLNLLKTLINHFS